MSFKASTPSAAWPTTSTPPSLPEEEAELVSGELLVVDDQGFEGHHGQAEARSGRSSTTSSGISIRTDVPRPGSLVSFTW